MGGKGAGWWSSHIYLSLFLVGTPPPPPPSPSHPPQTNAPNPQQGSGTIAGETSVAYHDIFTLTLVGTLTHVSCLIVLDRID